MSGILAKARTKREREVLNSAIKAKVSFKVVEAPIEKPYFVTDLSRLSPCHCFVIEDKKSEIHPNRLPLVVLAICGDLTHKFKECRHEGNTVKPTKDSF